MRGFAKRTAWVLGLGLVCAGGVARAGAATFEEAAEGATRVAGAADLNRLLEPLVDWNGASCGTAGVADAKPDDPGVRRCAAVKEAQEAALRETTYIGYGDEAALSLEPFDPAERSAELEVRGCLACMRPAKIDAGNGPQLRFVTTRVPKSIQARTGKVVGLDFAFHSLKVPDGRAVDELRRKINAGRLAVEYVFHLGPPWKSGSFEGVTFVPVAHRVVDRCTGKVLVSEPPSKGLAEVVRDARCPDEPTEAERRAQEDANLPERLQYKQVTTVMAGLRERLHECAREFLDEEGGKASIPTRIVVGPSGKVESVLPLAGWDKRPAGVCVRAAVRDAVFPRFRGEPMQFDYTLKLE